ncbi:NYN domain-containing protein [Cupriavidus consociatus]|uniref:NYN domain-containing protein n=1 Tax=Cupriavidus consociatus TaxID=2821357 RepID=UPI001AE89767|nr:MULTISPECIES: NYN domain-containing protein [unclassified Cupriavidus]MBP0622967.1 NYN domain-containing protein [Cupriavidus sp. LEh25]MDK2659655.1 NYN domain-containing protein [Cupriavidus sp. LEh21]
MTNSPRQGTATLAVLIDADNAAPAIVEGLLAEVAKYGVAAVKRIYGDWTRPNLAGWKERLLSHSIQPIQQFRYTVGKNATDSAMIIDAMDLLYTGRFDGFCIVSSDSDFTRLASRIREQGLIVYGFGERKTPKPFVTACDKFIYSDVLRAEADTEGAEGIDGAAAPTRKRSAGELRQDSRLVRLLQSAAQAVSDEDGWLTLGSMGNHIAKQAPEFDSRNYGYGKLSELVAATGLFEVETRNGGNNKTIWVRLKKRSKGGGEQQQRPSQQQPAPQPEPARRNPAPAVVEIPESAPEPVAVQLEPQAVEEPPFVAADAVQPEPELVPPLEAAPQPDPEPGADAEPKPRSRKRPASRPEVTLSETPWPIDQSVFAAPGATVLTATVEAEPEVPAQPEVVAEAAPAPAPAPARKPRKRTAKKKETTLE